MTKNFNITIADFSFEVLTMHVVKSQLYMVYVQIDGNKKRFHMQIDEHEDFKIADKVACPESVYPLEGALSEAIKQLGVLRIETVSM